MSSHTKKKKVQPTVVGSIGSVIQALLVIIVESIPVAIENLSKVIMVIYKGVSHTTLLAHASAHHAYARKTSKWPPLWFSIGISTLIAIILGAIFYVIYVHTNIFGGIIWIVCIWSLLQVGAKKKHP